jgi:small subunit ribosomal protein S15
MSLSREQKETIVKEFGNNIQDTGSTEVQIALLTKKIEQLTEHCKNNPKDHSSKKGLLKSVFQRKGYLKYLEFRDEVKYKNIVQRLGLRK